MGFLLVTLFCAMAGCTRERARAVDIKAATPEPEQKDYRELVERARSRQTTEQNIAALETATAKFMHDQGRLPSNLVELVAGNYLPEIPEAPEGDEFMYDPATGNIQLRSAPVPWTTNPSPAALRPPDES